jgi:hypothetical protein
MKVQYISCALLAGSLLFAGPAFSSTSLVDGAETATEVIEQSAVDAAAAKAALEDEKKRAEFSKTLVAARVGQAEITYYEVIQKMNAIVQRKFPDGAPDLPNDTTMAIRQEALDGLVLDQLAVNYAIRSGYHVPDKTIDDVINRVKKAYENEEGFQAYLDENGITEDVLRAKIRDSRILQTVTKDEIYGKGMVKPGDLQNIYDQYLADGRLHKSGKYIVKDLLMIGDASPAETKKKAEILLAKIKADNNQMGKLIMDGTFITRRFQVQERLNPAMYNIVVDMEVGQLSDVVEENGQFHIFIVVNKDLPRDLTMDEAKSFLETRLLYDAQQARKDDWHAELRAGEKVEMMLDEVEEKLNKEAR